MEFLCREPLTTQMQHKRLQHHRTGERPFLLHTGACLKEAIPAPVRHIGTSIRLQDQKPDR